MFALGCTITVSWITTLVIGGSEARSETYVRSHIGYMGQYYAGHGQFPWVVEIRGRDSENWEMQEEWSIGNLIGPKYVLTTCNAVANFVFVGSRKDRYAVQPKGASDYKVMYSPDYPYHGQWWYINRFAKWRPHPTTLKTGTREITRMSPHPFCNPNSLKYFWGMAEMGLEPIRPFRFFVNYAPPDLEATSLFRRWYKIRHKSVWSAALLSTWGRDYSDAFSKRTMLFNYKLKYQVKFQEWKECEKLVKKFGWGAWNEKLEWVNNTFCMSLYNPDDSMGAICDHDRGAPIVWEGYFVGIVVTGANITECSNLNPLPFVVQSIQDAQLYWTNVQRNVLSYFITNKTHLFPGLTGLVVTASISPPRPTDGGLALLIIGLLLILRPS